MEIKAGLEIASEGCVAVASFKSACISDVEEITNASAQLKQYIQTNQPRRMIFDFHGVKFFSSQVLGLLLEAKAHLRLQQRRGSSHVPESPTGAGLQDYEPRQVVQLLS